MKTMIERLTEDPENMRLFQQERLILDCTELVCELMETRNTSRKEIADKLGKTKGYITQLLNGTANMTVRTISDLMWALDSTLCVGAGSLELQPTLPKGDPVIEWKVHNEAGCGDADYAENRPLQLEVIPKPSEGG